MKLRRVDMLQQLGARRRRYFRTWLPSLRNVIGIAKVYAQRREHQVG